MTQQTLKGDEFRRILRDILEAYLPEKLWPDEARDIAGVIAKFLAIKITCREAGTFDVHAEVLEAADPLSPAFIEPARFEDTTPAASFDVAKVALPTGTVIGLIDQESEENPPGIDPRWLANLQWTEPGIPVKGYEAGNDLSNQRRIYDGDALSVFIDEQWLHGSVEHYIGDDRLVWRFRAFDSTPPGMVGRLTKMQDGSRVYQCSLAALADRRLPIAMAWELR